MPFVHIDEIAGHYLIVVEEGAAILLGIGYAFLILMVMYLANKPQPRPDWPKGPGGDESASDRLEA